MSKFLQLIIVIVIAALAGWGAAQFGSVVQKQSKEETAFERIIRTNTIRCGYGIWGPVEMVKDANTGALSGYDYDVMNAIGKLLGLKVEWTEEAGWGVAEQGIVSKRYDMFCNGVWPTPQRTRIVFYSQPFMYAPAYAFVSAHRQLAGNDMSWINKPDITAVVAAHTAMETVVDFKFPQAKKLDVSDLNAEGDYLMTVATGKADVGFSNYPSIEKFMASNPGQIQFIDQPVMYFAAGFLLPYDDYRLKHMIDFSIGYLLETGAIRDILIKYMPDSQRGWRYPAPPHE
jgi:ABC-type amino acid transport substrate-binding protein